MPALARDAFSYDLIRAVICAFSWRDEEHLLPVSTLAVQFELKRRNRDLSAAKILEALAAVGDVQRIDRGYWLPSPTHLVTGTGFSLVVSGLPDEEVIREFGFAPESAGVSRLLRSTDQGVATIKAGGQAVRGARSAGSGTLDPGAIDPGIFGLGTDASGVTGPEIAGLPRIALPVIPLEQWLGAPASTPLWTQEQQQTATYSAPYGMESAEIFRHWKSGPSGETARWLRLDSERPAEVNTVLARHRSIDGRANHYWLRLRGYHVTQIHELPPNTGDTRLRFMCGLRAPSDDPVSCKITRHSGDSAWVRVSKFIPDAERRLLDALGTVEEDERTGKLAVVVPERTLADVARVFRSLGCRISMETV